MADSPEDEFVRKAKIRPQGEPLADIQYRDSMTTLIIKIQHTVSQLSFRCARLALTFFVPTVTFFLTTCSKDSDLQTAIVKKDCTGTYLVVDGKNYDLCKINQVANFPDGATVKVKFKMTECNFSCNNYAICMMVRPSQGCIDIQVIY
jgi:hypothetical protein